MASSEHLQLAEFIKSVHSNLRKRSLEVGAEEAWKRHCSEKDVLSKYASAMKELATQHWEENYKQSSKAISRINWANNYVNQYFDEKGYLKYREKEIEIAEKMQLQEDKIDKSVLTNYDEVQKFKLIDVGSCYNPFKAFTEKYEVLAIDIAPANKDVIQCDFLNLNISDETIIEEQTLQVEKEQQFEGKSQDIKLKDGKENKDQTEVEESDKNSEGKLLTSLKSDGKENKDQKESQDCNKSSEGKLLTLKSDGEENEDQKESEKCFKNSQEKVVISLEYDGKENKNQKELEEECTKNSEEKSASASVISLKSEDFDIIVFSLLLEYLPSAEQRLQCCKNAYNLLKKEGILIIITPDSKHVGANAKIMKSWRYILAKEGFSRTKYEKLPHMHCMVFRKSIQLEIAKRWADLYKKDFYQTMIIPQDINNSNPNNKNTKNNKELT